MQAGQDTLNKHMLCGENWSRAVLCKQTQSETQQLQSSHLFRVFSSGGGHPWGCEHVHTCLSIYYRPASHRSNRVTVPLFANRWQHAKIQPQRIFARVGLVFLTRWLDFHQFSHFSHHRTKTLDMNCHLQR